MSIDKTGPGQGLKGGLAIAKVGYDQYLRFVWPLLLLLFVASATIIALAASFG